MCPLLPEELRQTSQDVYSSKGLVARRRAGVQRLRGFLKECRIRILGTRRRLRLEEYDGTVDRTRSPMALHEYCPRINRLAVFRSVNGQRMVEGEVDGRDGHEAKHDEARHRIGSSPRL
jgi:hypothetical protein